MKEIISDTENRNSEMMQMEEESWEFKKKKERKIRYFTRTLESIRKSNIRTTTIPEGGKRVKGTESLLKQLTRNSQSVEGTKSSYLRSKQNT